MKPLLFLACIILAVGSVVLTGLHGQTPATPPVPAQVELAPGSKCIVSVDPHVARSTLPASDNQSAGFLSDGTVRGELVLLSDEWCVLKEGRLENWIPRGKILLIRRSE